MYVVSSAARYAKLTISGSETVKFPRQFNVFGVKGDNITVSLTPSTTGDGVYNTDDGDGSILIAHYSNINTMYLTGSGDVIVWAGNNPDDCPFKVTAKGGGSGSSANIYRTTTALTDGSTTNPITVDGNDVTAVSGDFAIYNTQEFIFDGTTWSLLGDRVGLGDLAYKSSATGTALTTAGTLPSLVYDSTNERFTFSAGTLPTSGTVTVS